MSERQPATAEKFDARTHYQRDDVAASYDRVRFGGVSGALVHALERRMVLRALRAAGGVHSVLDLPAGTGRLLPLLHNEGFTPIGADISPAMLARARSRAAGAPLIAADGDTLPLRDGSVDAIVSLRLFPHLDAPQRERLLREMARVTRTAVVAVYQPHKVTAWYVLRNLVLRQHLPRHYVSHDEIVGEAARCGLELRASYALLPGALMERAYVFAHGGGR